MTGRNRPAYVELPTDLLDLPHPGATPAVTLPGLVAVDASEVVAAARLLAGARRPLLVPGQGVLRADAAGALRRLARRLDAPVLTPITGIGTVAADDPRWAGHMVPGQASTIALLEEADAVLVVGLRLDDVETGRWSLPFRNVIQIDVDAAAIGRAYPVEARVVGDARLALEGLLDELGSGPAATDDGWGAGRAKVARDALHEAVPPAARATRDAFLAARATLPRDAIVTHDAARVNSWTGYVWPVYEPDGSHFPWGSATLGWALPVANGMAVAAPGRRVVATCGDGGFLFTATELATAVAHQLDVTVLVHDDAAFGSIRVLPGAPLRQGLRVRPGEPRPRALRALVRDSDGTRRRRGGAAGRDGARDRRAGSVDGRAGRAAGAALQLNAVPRAPASSGSGRAARAATWRTRGNRGLPRRGGHVAGRRGRGAERGSSVGCATWWRRVRAARGAGQPCRP